MPSVHSAPIPLETYSSLDPLIQCSRNIPSTFYAFTDFHPTSSHVTYRSHLHSLVLCLLFRLSIRTLLRALLAHSLKHYWFEEKKKVKIIDLKNDSLPFPYTRHRTGPSDDTRKYNLLVVLLGKWLSPNKTQGSQRDLWVQVIIIIIIFKGQVICT